MKNSIMNKKKTIGSILLISTLLSIILLAASLSELNLQPGRIFEGSNGVEVPGRSSRIFISEDSKLIFFVQGGLAFVFLAFLIFVIIRLIVYVNLKMVGIAIFVIAFLIGILYLVPETNINRSTLSISENSITTAIPSNPESGISNGQPPQFLIWLILIPILVGIGNIVYKFFRENGSSSSMDNELSRYVEEAINDLEAGRDFNNVIIRCYFQMTNTLQKVQGVERHTAMTVREFESSLEEKGYPSKPVHRLTSLFEKIRYGEQVFNPDDEVIALESLNKIIQFAQINGEQNR